MRNFIYIGVTRTGSGSTQFLLSYYSGFINKNCHRNLTSTELKIRFRDQWNDAYKFAFVRHPIDRFISAYNVFVNKNEYLRESFPEKQLLESVEDALEWNPIVFRPQSDFLREEIDFIGRYENIKKDWAKVSKIIGVKEPLPHMNKTNRKPKKLTKKEEKYVRELYKEDFERFYMAM